VLSRARPCKVYGGHSGIGTDFFPVFTSPPLPHPVIRHCSIPVFIDILAFTGKTKGRSLATFLNALSDIGEYWR
jgi:hypothetical protein